MFYIDENDRPCASSSIDTIEKRLFQFDVDAEDYFLRYFVTWDKIQTDFYRIELNGAVFNIPSGMYILCGCDGGSQDWIMVDEIVGRPIEIILINNNYRSWSFCRPVVTDLYNGVCYTPMSKSPIPVTDASGKKVIIVSTVDQYHKLKDRDYDIFFV